jgi:hypothetical protein
MNMAELRIQIDDDLLTRVENAARVRGMSLDDLVTDVLLSRFPKPLVPRESFAEAARRIAAMTPPGVKQTDSVKILRSFRDGAAIEE